MRELETLPKSLSRLKKSPSKLYFKGDASLLERPLVSIVGTRRPNQYTKQLTLDLANKFSKIGFGIVSGGAMGVDALAHKGAFPNTIAVMANSLDIIYPKINQKLINDMEEKSLVLSEYPPNSRATRYTFVHRNRIVVALGEILIITQADLNSGSLRSFEFAKELKKDVFVLSHRVGESLGTQKLLLENEAEAIVDIDEFVSRFGKISKDTQDEELNFFDTPKSLAEALKKFGDELYMMELEGEIVIENLQVRRR